ncbi:MAG TPA: triose-phosphate isomerase family protein [Chloroflexota bacterium]|jgi:triosephosphate isomerase
MANPLVVGNWKMNTTLDDATRLVSAMLPGLRDLHNVDVVLCPPLPWLADVHRLVEGTHIEIGAQNLYHIDGGGYTGEVSARMVKGMCQYVLVGQYERRIYFDEKDGILKRKILAALKHGLQPILCVGENSDELDEGASGYVVAQQLEGALEDVPLDARLTVAYEPVWTTIGLVSPPPLSYVAQMCDHIRATLTDLFPTQKSKEVRVLYGGSISPRNIDAIVGEANADGVLTGSASVNAESFVGIARACAGLRAAPLA